MATKRKRASFSPSVNADTRSKKEEKPVVKSVEDKEEPKFQQIVEVVVEDTKDTSSLEEVTTTDVVSPAIASQDMEELKEKLRKEIKEEIKRELKKEQELEQDEDKEVEEEITEEESNVEEKEYTDLPNEENQEEDVEKQKETVAELFGKNSENIMPEITVHRSTSSTGLFIWAITMVAIAIGVGGGLVVFTNRSNNTTPSAVPTSGSAAVTPSPLPNTTSPSPSPKPTTKPLNKKDIKIQIQNGGGVVGAGSKMKVLLEKKGYTVTDVSNAANYTYEETEILVKESKSDIRDILEEDLSTDYTVGKVETALPENSPYDARVIVGKS